MIERTTLPPMSTLDYLFNYDRETGLLTWRVNPPRTGGLVGTEAGCPTEAGYRRVRVEGRYYLYHRICYKMAYREDPLYHVRHLGEASNNRPENLVSTRQ